MACIVPTKLQLEQGKHVNCAYIKDHGYIIGEEVALYSPDTTIDILETCDKGIYCEACSVNGISGASCGVVKI